MFPPGSVGVIGSSFEKKFGLDGIRDKRVVLVTDMPTRFSDIMSQSDFQSVVGGDLVTIARKNISALQKNWTAPLFMVGNVMPDFKDTAGSIARRIVTFKFETIITNRNTNMKDDIVQNELCHIVKRCIRVYRDHCAEIGSSDFWKSVPKSLRMLQEDLKTGTCTLTAFLQNGDDWYQVIRQQGAITKIQTLSHAYSKHMQNVQKAKGHKIDCNNSYPIRALGYQISKQYICKQCGLQANIATCKGHYEGGANRREYLVVHGMLLQQKKKPPQAPTENYGYKVTDPKAEA